MKIITRKQAEEENLKRFFTGIPCKNGHISERIHKGGKCAACVAYTVKSYTKRNKEKITAYQKEYVTLNKEKITAYQKEYVTLNKEKIIKYYCSNKDRISDRTKHYYLKNHDKKMSVVNSISANISIENGTYYKKWCDSEIYILLELLDNKKSFKYISSILGRSILSTCGKYYSIIRSSM